MSYSPSYKRSDWAAICDVCGFKFKASKLRKRWGGLYVCREDFEVRHPADFQKGIKDDPSVAWTRPEQTDVETSTSSWADTKTDIPTSTFDGSL